MPGYVTDIDRKNVCLQPVATQTGRRVLDLHCLLIKPLRARVRLRVWGSELQWINGSNRNLSCADICEGCNAYLDTCI